VSKIEIGLTTGQDVGTPETMERVLAQLREAPGGAVGYGSTEDASTSLPADASELSEIYRSSLVLFVRGERDGFLVMFQRLHTGWSQWNAWINRGAFTKDQETWLSWLFTLVGDLPVFFGYGCTEDEFAAKHEDVEELDDGTSAEGAVGVSAEELEHYLPGVYWLTILGPEATAHFEPKLGQLEGVRVERLEQGQAAIVLDEPVVAKEMEQRLRVEEDVASALGAEYFFRRGGGNLEPVPALAARLAELRGR
jgi:hypothetical protein